MVNAQLVSTLGIRISEQEDYQKPGKIYTIVMVIPRNNMSVSFEKTCISVLCHVSAQCRISREVDQTAMTDVHEENTQDISPTIHTRKLVPTM